MRLKGHLFDGKTSALHEATLFFDERGNIESDRDLPAPSSFKQIRISDRVGNTPRTITFPGGELFETVEHDVLNEIMQQHGRGESRLHRFESSTQYVVCALVLLVAFFTFGSIWGIPWLSTKIAYALPAEINTYIAHGALETLDRRIFKQSTLDKQRQSELTKSFNDLIPDGEQGFTYNLVFRAGGYIGANAFALPDGTVIITDELVELAEHDDEIIAVLLHEIGHVEHRHGLRSIINHAGLTALILTVTGDVSAAGGMVLALPNVLLESSYSRDLEWEADTYSLEYMQNHNIAPEHFANFMQRLENYSLDDADTEAADVAAIPDERQETADMDITPGSVEKEQTSSAADWFDYISSHPPSAERIARFRGPAD